MRFLIYAFGFFALTGCVATTVAPPVAEPRPEIEGGIERKVEGGIERQVEGGIERQVEGKIEEETKEEAKEEAKEGVENFIGEMVERHGFVQAELEDILGQAQYQEGIIK